MGRISRRRIVIGTRAGLLVGCVIALAGCGSSSKPTPTAAVSAAASSPAADSTAAAPTTRGSVRWGGDGVFSVGAEPSGGALASIPAGRYRVVLEGDNTFGTWFRCSSLPCSPTSPNQVDSGTASGAGFSTIVDVLPSDGAVYLDGVAFVQVN